MKFLLIVVLCHLGFSLAEEEGYWNRYEGEGDAAAETGGDWGEEETGRDWGEEETGYWGDEETEDSAEEDYVSTPPMPIRRVFGIRRWDVDDIVEKVESEEGTTYRLTDSIIEAVENDIIPELCYMTPENITIYNSYLLDKQCLEEFESVSPQCRGFRCNIVRYFLEHGARIYIDVINAPSLKEGLEVVNREILAAFEKLDMCTCGRQFFKAAFKCAPYWHANALNTITDDDGDSMMNYYKLMWNIDVKSFSRVFDRLLAGLCEESSHGMCINSIVNGLEKMLDLVNTTMEEYEDYDDGNRDFQKRQEKRCDALFGPIRAWTKDDRDLDYFEGEDQIELILNKTAAVSKAFYCKRGCRNDESRTAMYPCCWRKMLEDKKLFDNIVQAGESLYKVIPAMSSDFEWYFYELDSYFYRYTISREDLEERMNWTVPKKFRDAVMRTLHAAKYCDGKILRCSN